MRTLEGQSMEGRETDVKLQLMDNKKEIKTGVWKYLLIAILLLNRSCGERRKREETWKWKMGHENPPMFHKTEK